LLSVAGKTVEADIPELDGCRVALRGKNLDTEILPKSKFIYIQQCGVDQEGS
jgi:hypothetical protein